MVTEGFTDISALNRSLHYIQLGNLGKDMRLEFRLGALVAASKPWEGMSFPRESVQPGDSQLHLLHSLSVRLNTSESPNRSFSFNLPFWTYFTSNCRAVFLKQTSHSLRISTRVYLNGPPVVSGCSSCARRLAGGDLQDSDTSSVSRGQCLSCSAFHPRGILVGNNGLNSSTRIVQM